jgi:hypothetical protein
VEKDIRIKEKADEQAMNNRLTKYWEQVKASGWGNKLQASLKAATSNPNPPLRPAYSCIVPSMCITNQKIAKLRLEFKKLKKNPRLVAPLQPLLQPREQ